MRGGKSGHSTATLILEWEGANRMRYKASQQQREKDAVRNYSMRNADKPSALDSSEQGVHPS